MNTVPVFFRTTQFLKHTRGFYSAEVSELTHGGDTPLFGRLYNDAADEGFTLVCNETGREVRIYLHQTHTREGDITHWTCKSDPQDTRRLRIHPIVVTIFND